MSKITYPIDSISEGGIIWGYDQSDPQKANALAISTRGELISNDANIRKSMSPFEEIRTSQRTPQLELNSKFGLSKLRDIDNSESGGSVSDSGGEHVLSSGTNSLGVASVSTADIGRYMPGYASEIGIGMRMPNPPTGTQTIEWGGKSENKNECIQFGYDATGMYVKIVRNGSVSHKTYQSDWNIDKLDGSGPSGYTWDGSHGHIYQITYTWYGYGVITWSIVAPVDGVQRVIDIHSHSSFDNGTSVQDPNLGVDVEIKNNGTASDMTAFVGGRQYSIIGRYKPRYRFVSEYVIKVSTNTTNFVPLISFQRDPSKTAKATSIRLDSVSTSGIGDDHVIELISGASLTGPSWQTPTDHDLSEIITLSDTSATALTGGVVLHQDLIFAGTKKQQTVAERDFNFNLPAEGLITLAAKGLAGNGTITALLRIREEW